jgi:SEC-C motif
MNVKIGRNDSCPCGSGKKYKKCCLSRQSSPSSAPSYSWMAPDGFHMVTPGGPLTQEDLATMTRAYQQRIRQSSMWKQMVNEFGQDKAEALLQEFQAKPG